MTSFVIDAGALLHLAATDARIADEHELLAPTLIRSQTLSLLHESVAVGDLDAKTAEGRLARIAGMKIRLLGDAVLRRHAWTIADQFGWASTYIADYVALTQLQADAFITLDAELAHRISGTVAIASIDALTTR